MFCVVFMSVTNITRPSKTWWLTLALLLVLTLVFDNIIIWAGIVGYDTTKTLEVFIGYVPVEDFFYAILAAILVPVIWKRFDTQSRKEGIS